MIDEAIGEDIAVIERPIAGSELVETKFKPIGFHPRVKPERRKSSAENSGSKREASGVQTHFLEKLLKYPLVNAEAGKFIHRVVQEFAHHYFMLPQDAQDITDDLQPKGRMWDEWRERHKWFNAGNAQQAWDAIEFSPVKREGETHSDQEWLSVLQETVLDAGGEYILFVEEELEKLRREGKNYNAYVFQNMSFDEMQEIEGKTGRMDLMLVLYDKFDEEVNKEFFASCDKTQKPKKFWEALAGDYSLILKIHDIKTDISQSDDGENYTSLFSEERLEKDRLELIDTHVEEDSPSFEGWQNKREQKQPEKEDVRQVYDYGQALVKKVEKKCGFRPGEEESLRSRLGGNVIYIKSPIRSKTVDGYETFRMGHVELDHPEIDMNYPPTRNHTRIDLNDLAA